MRRDAGFTATGAGIDVPAGTRVLLAEPNVVGADTHLEPSLSLGPGAWGGSSTGDNVSDRHLTNRKRLAWGRDALSAAEDLKTDGISDERLRRAVAKALDELDAGDAEGLLLPFNLENRKGVMMCKVAWGLDLAGLSSTKQGLARAERIDDNTIHITIYKKHIFSNKILKVDTEAKVCNINLTKRIKCLKNITPLFVDVPIDNTYFNDAYNNPGYIWQLNLRPVDRAYNGQRPLGSLMGGYVQQFKYMHNKSELTLGKNLYETYPAASLIELGINAKYKKTISVYKENKWTTSIGGICDKLNISPIDNTELKINDDEIDAVLCALCGVVDDKYILNGDDLEEHIKSRINDDNRYKAPEGYVLLQLAKEQEWPYTIEIKKDKEPKFDDCKDT